MVQPLLFVNYGSSSTETAANRHIVSSHIGKYHRNRSRPSVPRPATGKVTASITRVSRQVSQYRKSQFPLTQDPIEDESREGFLELHQDQTLVAQINQQSIDPFRTSMSPITPEMQPALLYYFNTIMPVVEPTFAERNEYQEWLIPLIMSEATLHYALLACMTHDIEQASLTRIGLATRKPLYMERQQYSLRARRALNECLSDAERAVQASTLMAVHFLLWQETFIGDENIRMEDVQRLIDVRGGFHGMQRKAVEAIMVGAHWKAIRTRTKPQLQAIVEDTPFCLKQLSKAVNKSLPVASQLGEGFLKSEIKVHFDDEVRDMFEDARTIWICFEMIGIHRFSAAQKRSISIQRMNLDNRLLSYHFGEGSRSMQEACLRALIIFSNAHYNVIHPSSQIARYLVEDMKHALLATELSSCRLNLSPILIWTLFLGAHMSSGQPERSWFLVLLAKTITHCGFKDWSEARHSLLTHYYSDRVFESSFVAIWKEVQMLSSVLEQFGGS